MGSSTMVTARWSILSSTVGNPIGRSSFPFFGTYARLTGGAR